MPMSMGAELVLTCDTEARSALAAWLMRRSGVSSADASFRNVARSFRTSVGSILMRACIISV